MNPPIESQGVPCTACGAPVKPGKRFCGACGKPVAQAAPPPAPPPQSFTPPPPPWETAAEPAPSPHSHGPKTPATRAEPPALPPADEPPPPPRTRAAAPRQAAPLSGASLGGIAIAVIAATLGRSCATNLLSGGGAVNDAWKVCQKRALDDIQKKLNNQYQESGRIMLPGKWDKMDYDRAAKRYRFEGHGELTTDQTRSRYDMPFVCTAVKVNTVGVDTWQVEGIWYANSVKR